MPIGNYDQYRALPRVNDLEAGDLLLKKVFPETRKTAVEWVITTGQRLFSGDRTIKTGSFFSREKFRVTYNGSHTSEHAAVAISAEEIAEAVGEGVLTASVRGRREERYVVYRCLNAEMARAAVVIARGLSNAYHNVVTGSRAVRTTSGGQYSLGGAFVSSLRTSTFQQGTTNTFLTWVVDYVQGLRHDRPNLFCSEFAMTCYEAGSLAAFGRTAMGTNPQAMSPMQMEDTINGRQDLFRLAGKYDSEDDVLYTAIEHGLKTYSKRWHFNQSSASAKAIQALNNLMLIGDDEYLLAAASAYLNAPVMVPLSIRCRLPQGDQLSPSSSLYRDLANALRPTRMLNIP
jgi:hypothetical protein